MKKLITALLIIGIIPVISFSQKSFETYYQLSDMIQASPGSFRLGLYGFENPAILNYNTSHFDMTLLASEQRGKLGDFDRWGLFFGMGNLGFGALTNKIGDMGVTDYRLALGFGDTKFGMGFTYGWSGGDVDFFGRSNLINIGALYRPIPELSVAANYMKSTSKVDAEFVGEIAIRPIGSYPLAVFADMSLQNHQSLKDISWSSGISWEILDGIRVNGRYFDNKAISLGVDVSFGNNGISSISQFDNDQKYAYNTYGIRVGGRDRTIFDEIVKPRFYAMLNLNGNLAYQRFQWFDNSMTLLDVLNIIEKAKKNDMIQGLVINTSQFNASRAMLWEIREKLEDFKSTGKKVVIYIERCNIDMYAFATVADQIIMERMGTIQLNGYAMGRSFYKKMFENFGIGFQEMRYFKYKSALEGYSRESFSEGDREQRQKMVDDWYDIASDMITSSRKFTKAKFDSLVNSYINYLSNEAIDLKLVDNSARFTELDSIVRNWDKSIMAIVPSGFLFEEPLPIDDQWAYDKSAIAVIYALGACDMNSGISARNLIRDITAAYNSSRIKAIVLRVDSPGGDALASDYIAKVIRDNKGKKPLIVSQGSVAASGGYWLSMDADVIVSTPVTVTGSIGVIGGYVYDKGLKDSIGISYDIVKRGKFADLYASYTMPLIPVGLPYRPLTDEEMGLMKGNILTLYDEFVRKVANGRKISEDKVRELGQGRIWSGKDAKNNGLVDELGGLSRAIEIAREKAGIPKTAQVNIIEMPKAGWINFSQFMPSLIGIDIEKPKAEIEMLKFLFGMNGQPMPMLPVDYLDFE